MVLCAIVVVSALSMIPSAQLSEAEKSLWSAEMKGYLDETQFIYVDGTESSLEYCPESVYVVTVEDVNSRLYRNLVDLCKKGAPIVSTQGCDLLKRIGAAVGFSGFDESAQYHLIFINLETHIRFTSSEDEIGPLEYIVVSMLSSTDYYGVPLRSMQTS